TGLSPSSNYFITYWSKSGSISISGGTHSNNITGKTINGWTYHEVTITGTSSIYISGSGYIDELRLYPINAQITTYTYKPLHGMTSKCNNKNNITYYQYDGFGRLKLVRDENGNIIKQYAYHYHTPQVTYYNTEQSQSF